MGAGKKRQESQADGFSRCSAKDGLLTKGLMYVHHHLIEEIRCIKTQVMHGSFDVLERMCIDAS